MKRIVTTVLLALGLLLIGVPAQAATPPSPPGQTTCHTTFYNGRTFTKCRTALNPPGLQQCHTTFYGGRTYTKCSTVWPNAQPRTRIRY